MTTPTIPEDVMKACENAFLESGDSGYLADAFDAIYKYDELVCQPLREELIFNEQRNISAWRAFEEEKNQEIGRIREQRDAALKLVVELKNDKTRLDWIDRIRHIRETFKEL